MTKALILDFGGVISRTLFETHAMTEAALGLPAGTLTWRGTVPAGSTLPAVSRLDDAPPPKPEPPWAKISEKDIAAVDFRMPPDAIYPASLQDVNYAVRWFKLHAKEFNIDAKRVGILGVSSGGHQAMLTALRPRDPVPRGIENGCAPRKGPCRDRRRRRHRFGRGGLGDAARRRQRGAGLHRLDL
mgnify:CR=1 FL=1